MTKAFDDLQFLMGSENRLAVLSATAEEPMTRADLVEAVDSSGVTVGRILDDLLERRWIEPGSAGYEATYFGQAIAEDAAALEQTVDISNRLWPVCEYFETDRIGFDPRYLAEARMSRGPEDSAFHHVDRWAQLFRSCDVFTGITSQIPQTLVEVLIEQLRVDELAVIGAFPGDLVDRILEDPEQRSAFRQALEQGARLYRDDAADWDLAIGLYDEDRMSFVGFDDSGTPRFKVESGHPNIRRWGESMVETVLERSEPITVGD